MVGGHRSSRAQQVLKTSPRVARATFEVLLWLFLVVASLSVFGKHRAMLGAAAAGLLKGHPGMNRAGAMALVAGARSVPAAVSRPGHGALLSSMTPSRSGVFTRTSPVQRLAYKYKSPEDRKTIVPY